MKKQMIECIMVNNDQYYDTTNNNINTKQLKKFKKSMFYFFNKQTNNQPQYKQIKILWSSSLGELKSEAIVESICSTLKKIYGTDRRYGKYLTSRIKLRFQSPPRSL